MNKGTVLFHSRFTFINGEIGEKLLIILNNPDPSSEPYLTCRTTSQERNRSTNLGCQPENSAFYLPANSDFLQRDTWIQLHEVFSFEASSLLKDHFDGELRIIGQLREDTIRQLMNCIKKIRDIPVAYKKMILK